MQRCPLQPTHGSTNTHMTHLQGLTGCSPPARDTSWGVQWPPGNSGVVHSRQATCAPACG